jgi:hypothetical protein
LGDERTGDFNRRLLQSPMILAAKGSSTRAEAEVEADARPTSRRIQKENKAPWQYRGPASRLPRSQSIALSLSHVRERAHTHNTKALFLSPHHPISSAHYSPISSLSSYVIMIVAIIVTIIVVVVGEYYCRDGCCWRCICHYCSSFP